MMPWNHSSKGPPSPPSVSDMPAPFAISTSLIHLIAPLRPGEEGHVAEASGSLSEAADSWPDSWPQCGGGAAYGPGRFPDRTTVQLVQSSEGGSTVRLCLISHQLVGSPAVGEVFST